MPTNPQSKSGRWWPTEQQLRSPSELERAFRQMLTQHYALQDKYDALAGRVADMPLPSKEGAFPPGSGPSDTKLLGLNVEPVDTQTLTNGATLKYNRSRGTFSFQ